jgi:type I restriction enzyme S subunit
VSVRTVQVEQIAAVFNGKTPSKAEQRNSGHPVLKIKDVDENGRFIGRFDSFVDLGFAEGLPEKIVQDGDTLILNAAHNAEYVASKSFFAHGSAVGAIATGEWLVLRPVSKQANARFLFYWSQHAETRKKLEALVKGIHLYPKDVAELPISLPELSEQERIAELLKQADRLRRIRRYAFELSDTFLAAAFLEVFGDPKKNPKNWPYEPLARLCDRFSDGPFGSNLKSAHYRSSGIRVIRLQNIGVGEFLDEDKSFISIEHFAELRKHECRPGDVLIGTLGDPNLRACIQRADIHIALNKADCVQARPNPHKVTAEFLCWLLNIPSTLLLTPGMVHGQTRERISMGQLAELPVPVPPVSFQKQFTKLVSRHEHLRATQRETLRQAEHQFQSLLRRAFAQH